MTALHLCRAPRRAHDVQSQSQLLPTLVRAARVIHDATARRGGTTSLVRTYNKPVLVRSIDPRGAFAPDIRAIAVGSLQHDPDLGMPSGSERAIIKRCCMTAHFLST